MLLNSCADGLGLAAAVLIDATVVRGILLPAALAVLGERSWYLPGWLAWLPGDRTARAEVAVTAAPEPLHRRASSTREGGLHP